MEQRSTSRSISADDLVVGLIRSPHGLRGEVKVESQTDVEGRFRKGARLLCDDIGEIVIASVRGPADVPIVRFEGFASRRDADRLRGKRLRVARGDARRAAKSGFLWADLLGLRAVTPAGDELGTVHEILRAGETDVLVVRREGRREDVLLPTIASVVREIDVPGGRVVVVPQEAA
jgi:16S rRNA processing protein RimM